jgi:hypothetical protein
MAPTKRSASPTSSYPRKRRKLTPSLLTIPREIRQKILFYTHTDEDMHLRIYPYTRWQHPDGHTWFDPTAVEERTKELKRVHRVFWSEMPFVMRKWFARAKTLMLVIDPRGGHIAD